MSENPGPYMYVLSQVQLDALRHEWLISDEGDAAVTAAAASYHKTECAYGIELAALRQAVEGLINRDHRGFGGVRLAAFVSVADLRAAMADANSQPGSNLAEPGSKATVVRENFCPTCGAQRDEPCKYVSADSPELAGLTRVGAGQHPARRWLGGAKWNV